MWRKLLHFFAGKTSQEPSDAVPPWQELTEEVKDLKKLLRRQGILFESVKKELLEKMEESGLKSADPLFRFTDAFFHLDASSKHAPGLTPDQDQALQIVWQRLESLLASTDIQVIRQTGGAYNPRLHEAVEKLGESSGNLIVKEILLPGYIFKGKVVRPAKVVVAHSPPQPYPQ